MRFALEQLGNWTPERPFTVERERIKAYAAATNETKPAFVQGDVAPPVFAIVPAWEAIHEATAAVVPEEARPRVVHGEQDLVLHAPLRPGMRLTVRSAVVGVHPKSSGTTVVVKIETRDEPGAIVNEQWVTEFYRGIEAAEGGGETAPDRPAPDGATEGEPLASVTYAIDEDQTFRYADASGDHNVFHLDDAAAKAVGLPGIIVHGLCVMALTGRAVLEAAGGRGRVRRLAVRFARPVFPGDRLTTRVWPAAAHAYAFETLNEDGDAVIRNGWAELDPDDS
jgi:acyl dehydratase